ncbi:MAG: single-stranded DNA-binding protein [Candidatus Delongbacteria bacterium]|jgi:single-strand DNA-binding protein|nr:single-stranded DNA-binding protein [Candidatus Delongbacteria bacterium]MDD4205069.1 single-stranded DNA-binding protein [Candidatus Delongbacteria bacterium]MDY0017977.1 single-stranded DNA-binding protein [Candidatus Delongbacteria bacterium]
MPSVNKVFLIGNLGKDPEVKYTPSGVQIAKFSLATSERVKRNEAWEEKTDWHNIVLFARQAEYAGEYLKKGMTVFIDGKISTRSWDDENGVRKYITEIIGNVVKNLSVKRDDTSSSSDTEDNGNHNSEKDTEPMDDLPF